jgi:hypothetical protein
MTMPPTDDGQKDETISSDFRPVVGKDGAVTLYDIYVSFALHETWIGSRRSKEQCHESFRAHVRALHRDATKAEESPAARGETKSSVAVSGPKGVIEDGKQRWVHKRTRDELEAALREQIGFLRSSADSYDRGSFTEAKRLSGTCYTLLYDGNQRTRSLLGQLGLKDEMQFIGSAFRIGSGADSWLPLCVVTAQPARKRVIFQPHLGRSKPRRKMKFAEWWEEVVYDPLPDLSLSRRNLILAMRNQDGGGHVDGTLSDAAYHRLVEQGAARFSYTIHEKHAIALHADKKLVVYVYEDGKGPPPRSSPPQQIDHSYYPILNGHLASVRQIAWELDESLKLAGF